MLLLLCPSAFAVCRSDEDNLESTQIALIGDSDSTLIIAFSHAYIPSTACAMIMFLTVWS